MNSIQQNVATVVLNYNSSEDVAVLLPQLIDQRGIENHVIIVDNASESSDVLALSNIFLTHCPSGIVTTSKKLDVAPHDQATAYLVLNHENRGYSAGNNIGIRLAEKLGADAVLIANPDMRIEDQEYIAKLADTLFSDESNAVAASRILGLDGKDQNPLRESTFFEEFAWPIMAIRRKLGIGGSYVVPIQSLEPMPVKKVSGCCMMIRISFLVSTGYLDENVFLYCEEPILSAKVRREQKTIVYNPKLRAIHAHRNGSKGRVRKNVEIYTKSRAYYLNTYSSYNSRKQYLILCSMRALVLMHKHE